MTQEELKLLLVRFNEIKQGSSQLKVGRLQVLLKDLKETYNIPSYPSVIYGRFRKENPEVATLYLDIVDEFANSVTGRVEWK